MATKEQAKQKAKDLLKALDITEGRKVPTRYTKAYGDRILLLIRKGVFYRDACYALGLDLPTMIVWLHDNPKFARDVIKFRYQAICNIQESLWMAGIAGDLQSILIFLKAIEYDNEWLSSITGQNVATLDKNKWNVKQLEEPRDDIPDKVIFVDRILE